MDIIINITNRLLNGLGEATRATFKVLTAIICLVFIVGVLFTIDNTKDSVAALQMAGSILWLIWVLLIIRKPKQPLKTIVCNKCYGQ